MLEKDELSWRPLWLQFLLEEGCKHFQRGRCRNRDDLEVIWRSLWSRSAYEACLRRVRRREKLSVGPFTITVRKEGCSGDKESMIEVECRLELGGVEVR